MDYERERRRQKRYREAMRNRIIAAVLLAGIIVGAIFIIKGCKKDDAPADDAQNTNQPVDNVGDTTTPDDGVIVDDELLTLVNPWNPLPDDWTVDLVTLDDGHRVDSRCYEAYMEMINACKAAGYSPVNCSSYRAQETPKPRRPRPWPSPAPVSISWAWRWTWWTPICRT